MDKPALSLDALSQRVEGLENERGILNTLSVYGHALDYGDMDTFLNCFTEDADYLTNRVGNFKGRAEIDRFFRARRHAPEKYNKHVLVDPIVTMDGPDTANVISYYCLLQDRPGGPFVSHFGRYKDRLVRCEDGMWRFQVRQVEGEAVAPAVD
jgi:ketosteroid isomerase-like protein